MPTGKFAYNQWFNMLTAKTVHYQLDNQRFYSVSEIRNRFYILKSKKVKMCNNNWTKGEESWNMGIGRKSRYTLVKTKNLIHSIRIHWIINWNSLHDFFVSTVELLVGSKFEMKYSVTAVHMQYYAYAFAFGTYIFIISSKWCTFTSALKYSNTIILIYR